mgnify:CR=1 FL=1
MTRSPSHYQDDPQFTADRLVLEQAARSPDAVAALAGEERLTYRELEQASGKLAGRLRASGMGSDTRVGLAIEPGLARGIGILATLRSGAAYVPLDPAYPRARLEFMARDAQVSLILASPNAVELLQGAAPTWNVEEVLAGDPGPYQAGSAAEAGAPAYVIYTSGSTGTPKGVVLPHRALANLVDWQLREPGIGRAMRTLQFTPVSFDVHFQEFFGTWGAGGELVYLEEPLRRDTARLLSFMDKEEIEQIFLPFVALQQLADVATAHGPLPKSLKEVVTAGEQLRVNPVLREFFQRIPECRLHNHYGPSETHVVTAHTLTGPPSDWPTLPPIGKAIPNVALRLMGDDGKPVSPGENGELCVSGVCLADGYWRRPDLTASRFVAAPTPGRDLMYRTGDLARDMGEGTYEFLGRLDDQVKIRGHRVEPGEIEGEILKHPGVRECTVVAQDSPRPDRRLTAYLVLDSAQAGMEAAAQRVSREKVSHWRTVWDGTYARGAGFQDMSLDLSGWVDSYGGHPIPPSEMEEWAEGTARQALEVNPERVLEVGCGTGLMLFRIAPHCGTYHATDFSPQAIRLLQERASTLDLCPDLRLEVAAAHDPGLLGDGRYDLVLLNSVTQHFPSLTYLLEVLRNAVDAVGDGFILVGDVANRRLREAFFVTVEGLRAGPEEDLATLRGRVERGLGEEEELVIDPEFFQRLGDWLPRVDSVDVRLKPGRYRNELSRFRYDVLIRVGSQSPTPLDVRNVPWDATLMDSEALRTLLSQEPHRAVVIHGVPNVRVQEAVLAAETLRAGEGETVAGWRAQLAERVRVRTRVAVEPEDLKQRIESLGRPVSVTWGERSDTFDLIVRPRGADYHPVKRLQGNAARRLEELGSQPLNVALMPQVVRELRRDLRKTLPDPMIPDRFELLARLPKTPSGKLDRRSLPEPSGHRPPLPHDFVAPEGELESKIASVWSEVLDIDEVGVTDSFFDLGGNSILSVRLSLALQDRLARKLPLVLLFQYPTVRTLAAFLGRSPEEGPHPPDQTLDERAEQQRRAFARSRRFKRK